MSSKDEGKRRARGVARERLRSENAPPKSTAPTRSHSNKTRRADLFFWPLLTLAALPRIWAAFADQGQFWPDEVFQTLEQAHRLAFGYGLIPWEFSDGARSWLFPGALAAVLKVAAWLGARSGLTLVIVAKLGMVALNLVGIGAAMRLAERLGGNRDEHRVAPNGTVALILTGLLCATYPPLVVFGARCMTETASATLLVLAALWSLPGTEPQKVARAGVLAGLAIFLRYQNGLFAAGLLVSLLLVRRNWRSVIYYSATASAVGVAGGLLDFVTWGQPFHSFVRYVQFNFIEGRAAGWGTAPADYYVQTFASSVGLPLGIVLLVGLVLSLRRALALGLILFLYVVIHSSVPHKEFRFMLPIMPLGLALAGTGLSSALRRVTGQAQKLGYALVVGVALAVALAYQTTQATFRSLGQPAGLGAEFSGENHPWHAGEAVNRALLEAAAQPALCGIIVAGVHPAVTGGFSYLHRNVPLLFYWPGALGAANFYLARAGIVAPPGYGEVFSVDDMRLFRRPGGCTAPPRGYDTLIR